MQEAGIPPALLSPSTIRREPARVGSLAGFTYLGVLFLIVLMGLGLAAVADVWHMSSQRDKEVELLFIGSQFRNAITRYSETSPGTATRKEFPQKLEDLLEDKRFGAVTVRHLRKIYIDPMTGKTDWGLVTLPGIGIVGVHSKSVQTPIKTAGFPAAFNQFNDAKAYTDWIFAPSNAPSAIAPTGSAAEGIPAAVAGPLAAGPGSKGTQLDPQQLAAPSDPRADAAAGCQARYATLKTQCDSATQRGGRRGGQTCLDRAFQQLNACLDQAGQL